MNYFLATDETLYKLFLAVVSPRFYLLHLLVSVADVNDDLPFCVLAKVRRGRSNQNWKDDAEIVSPPSAHHVRSPDWNFLLFILERLHDEHIYTKITKICKC